MPDQQQALVICKTCGAKLRLIGEFEKPSEARCISCIRGDNHNQLPAEPELPDSEGGDPD